MRNHGFWVFLTVTFGFSWATAALIWKSGGLTGAYGIPLTTVFMTGPAIGALIAAWIYDRGRLLETLGLRFRPNLFWLLAVILPIVIAALSVGFSICAPNVGLANFAEKLLESVKATGVDPDTLPLSANQLVWLTILLQLPVGIAINAILLLTEELGWRGWLWGRWRMMGFWRCNLAIGLIWGVWHVPIIAMGHNYPGMPISGSLLMILFTLLMSPIIGWLREYGRSVFAASIFHGAINALGGITFLLLTNNAMPWRGLVGIGGMAALFVLWGPIYWHQRRAKTPNELS